MSTKTNAHAGDIYRRYSINRVSLVDTPKITNKEKIEVSVYQ